MGCGFLGSLKKKTGGDFKIFIEKILGIYFILQDTQFINFNNLLTSHDGPSVLIVDE